MAKVESKLKNNKMKNKAFTLLELLVVIAIIGILATIVLVSLQGARRRAQDSAIVSEMSQIRTAAEMHRIDTGSYDDLMANEEVVTLVESIEAVIGVNEVIYSIGDGEYCIAAPTVVDDEFHCIDSSGSAGRVTGGCDTEDHTCFDTP